MIIALMALLGAAGEVPSSASAEIERMLAQAGLTGAVSDRPAPLAITSATQDYGAPTRDACCHTMTPLQIGARQFTKGIGAHSKGRIVVQLNEPAESFHAWVGIDHNNDTMTRGSAIFSVIVDGQERYTSPVCRGGEEPREVNVDLAGARELVLAIGDAGDGNAYDQSDWAEASVVVKGKTLYLGDLFGSRLFQDVPTSFDYDGENCWKVFASWKSETGPSRKGDRGTEYRRTWKDGTTGFAATLCATVYADPAACELRWEFEAASGQPSGLISSVRSIDFSASAHDGQLALLSSSGGMTGSLTGANERTGFKTESTQLGSKSLASVGGRSSNGDLPFFMLTRLPGNMAFAAGLAWSGQWTCNAAYDNQRKATRLVAGMDPCKFRVPAGERVVMPGALFVPFTGDTQQGANALRRVIRAHYAAPLEGQLPLPPVSFNSWFTFTNNVNEKMLCELADASAGLGLDYFCLDAGWFDGDFPEGVGNWTVNAAKFPRGLRAVADHVHQQGMKFGLWFEPERVANGSRWQREHPEWLLGKNLINFGDPAARTAILDMMSGIIKEVGVDWIRYDFNIDPLDSWGSAEGPEQQGLVQLRYINGLYALLDELMRRHPGLFIEQCASGGRRIDLETMRRGHSYWKSDDTLDQPLMRFHETGGNHFLPGGFLNTNYCQFRSQDDVLALFAGPLGFGLDFRALNPTQKDAIRQAIAAYKHVRRFINEDYYPLFDQSASPVNWVGWQFIDPKSQEGFLCAYRPAASPYDSATIPIRGLRPDTAYVLKNLISGEERKLPAAGLAGGLSLTLPKDTAQVWSFTIVPPGT
ncbi:MAG: alpha-galactosidase [Candidatus Hydrogenedentes bacterium]|nr:alpha-galactosidase [Candidatus Hydrogenedentota bacterium]